MIMVVKKLFVKNNQKGQGIIEFLLFLPFILTMYSVILSISNAINASINQQKVARNYWHYRMMNNSTIPRPSRRGGSETADSWRKFGMEIMGWSEKLDGPVPVAPCFKFLLPLGDSAGDECEDTYEGATSQFMRVHTVYGMCGASYARVDSQNISYPRAMFAGQGEFGPEDHCKIIE